MHFMPDTEEEDSAAETFWPEGYKQVIRNDLRQSIGARVNDDKELKHIYYERYSESFADVDQFLGKITGAISIGAENGADDAFDNIISAFLTESPLPEVRIYARYFWSQAFPRQFQKRLCQVIINEYRQDDVYIYAYKVGYKDSYRNLTEFIGQVARIVLTETMNGADDMLGAIYSSFMTSCPLPPARRHPRRLKSW